MLLLFYDMEERVRDAFIYEIAKLQAQKELRGEDDGGSSGRSKEESDDGGAGSSPSKPNYNSGSEKEEGDEGVGGHDRLTAQQVSRAASAAFAQKLLGKVGTPKARKRKMARRMKTAGGKTTEQMTIGGRAARKRELGRELRKGKLHEMGWELQRVPRRVPWQMPRRVPR